MITQIPFGIITREIVFGQRRRTVSSRIYTIFLVVAIHARDSLWHDTISAINELLDAP